jgi:RNase adaptor protein for sRNA GlmZ degradation
MAIVDITTARVGIFALNKWSSTTNQYEFDLTGFRDPQAKKDLRSLYGTDPKVQEFIKADPRLEAVIDACRVLVRDDDYRKGHYISFGFRDHHGRWISSAVAEIVGKILSDEGYNVYVSHFGVSANAKK